MDQPNLPYWFYSGHVSVSIDGPVYVLKPDGTVVGGTGPSVIVPRSKFFATARATSHLVSRKLIKRLPDPKRVAPAVEPAVAAPVQKEIEPAAPTKSEAVEAVPSRPERASSEPEQKDVVIASGAGEGEAGSSSSAPEEQEQDSSGRSGRRSRRS